MTLRAAASVLAVWAIVTATLCGLVDRAFALREQPAGPQASAVLASVWSRGACVFRMRVARAGESSAPIDRALASSDGAVLRFEEVTDEGPLPTWPDAILALSLAPGRDGIAATVAGRTEYLTPDDLLARQAYRHGVRFPVVELSLGVDVPLVFALLADRFGLSVSELRARATLRRARFARAAAGEGHAFSAGSPTPGDLGDAALAAARFVARGTDAQGRFRYLVDGATNQTLPGYDWPRHAGATYFLARVASRSRDPDLGAATLRAAALLRKRVVDCGPLRCVADADAAEIGSSALAALAFAEIARSGLDPSYGQAVADLAAFLRGQQRPDGEFMHRYDRAAARPIDVQYLYFSGEATLALARAHTLGGDPRDLDAARRGVAHLVGPAWSFFGSRYYFGEEHWTCEAVADLWDRMPDRDALDFCLRWLAFWRKLEEKAGESPYDADGAYGVGPLQVPALTPVASRCEAGLATLAVAARSGVDPAVVRALDTQLERSLALLLRQQFRAASPARAGLVADAAAIDGALPASEVDWSLRIDFAQHAGGAFLRRLESADRGVAK